MRQGIRRKAKIHRRRDQPAQAMVRRDINSADPLPQSLSSTQDHSLYFHIELHSTFTISASIAAMNGSRDLTDIKSDQQLDPMATIAVEIAMAPAVARLRAVPKFDPALHLVGARPASKMSMQEVGFEEDVGVSPVAVSEPFQLFTAEAVDIMRDEIFRVPEKYKYSSNIAKSQLRGYAKE